MKLLCTFTCWRVTEHQWDRRANKGWGADVCVECGSSVQGKWIEADFPIKRLHSVRAMVLERCQDVLGGDFVEVPGLPSPLIGQTIVASGLVGSNRELHEFVKQGALKLNGVKLTKDWLKRKFPVGLRDACSMFILARGRERKIVSVCPFYVEDVPYWFLPDERSA